MTKNAVCDKWCTAIAAAVSEMLHQLISFVSSLSFYTTFSHPDPPFKPCGYCTFLIMMQNVRFSPYLYNTACQFYEMFLVTSPFLYPFIRFFLTLTSQALRLFYLLDNDAKLPVLTQPLHHSMTRFTEWSPWPSIEMQNGLSFCRWRCGGWVYKNKYQNEYQMAYPCLILYLIDVTLPVLTQPLHHRIDSFTRNDLPDLWKWRTCKLAGPVCRLNFTIEK